MLAKTLELHYGLPVTEIPDLMEIKRKNENVPAIVFSHDDNPHLKCVDEIVDNKSEYSDRKVILLARDIRDLMVSLYFHMTRRSKKFDGSISEFMRLPRGGLKSVVKFYNVWAENQFVPEKSFAAWEFLPGLDQQASSTVLWERSQGGQAFFHQLMERHGDVADCVGRHEIDGFGQIARRVVTFLDQPGWQSSLTPRPLPHQAAGDGAGKATAQQEIEGPGRVAGWGGPEIRFHGSNLFMGAGGAVELLE